VEVKGHEARIKARNRSLEANRKHVLKIIKVLFISESLPADLVCNGSAYFYISGPERRYSLTYYMNEALFRSKIVEKEKFFEELGKHGFYLIDMIKCPFKNSDLCGVKGN
jgi:hypothetical protein